MRTDPAPVLQGAAVWLQEADPCRLDYRIVCDPQWHTRSVTVTGFVGAHDVDIEIASGPEGWTLDGRPCPQVAGAVDIDLNFSPSTNLLPIRRLDLAIGEERGVRAAWLRFPGFALEPLEQTYRRLDRHTYRYSSADGAFVRDLPVDARGFVLAYPDFWRAEPG